MAIFRDLSRKIPTCLWIYSCSVPIAALVNLLLLLLLGLGLWKSVLTTFCTSCHHTLYGMWKIPHMWCFSIHTFTIKYKITQLFYMGETGQLNRRGGRPSLLGNMLGKLPIRTRRWLLQLPFQVCPPARQCLDWSSSALSHQLSLLAYKNFPLTL